MLHRESLSWLDGGAKLGRSKLSIEKTAQNQLCVHVLNRHKNTTLRHNRYLNMTKAAMATA